MKSNSLKLIWILALVLIMFGSIINSKKTITFEEIKESDNISLQTGDSNLESPVCKLGKFNNIKSIGDHTYGLSVELWEYEKKYLGFIYIFQGLDGDPPVGLLENIRFDSKTKRIQFTAKLSLGLSIKEKNKQLSSQDILEFDGVLSKNKLIGVIKQTNLFCENGCQVKKRVKLTLNKDWELYMKDYKKMEEWQLFATDLLNLRGPRF